MGCVCSKSTEIDGSKFMEQQSQKPAVKAIIFTLASEGERIHFESFRAALDSYEVFDTLEDQLAELLVTRTPLLRANPEGLAGAVSRELGKGGWDEFGSWAWYPWSRSLVRVLDENDFIELRTNRNRNKITLKEQLQLKEKQIGIIGLSVGSAFAMSLAMERTCGSLKVADFDDLELSNLNRIQTGIKNLGLPKWASISRAIAEVDPYFEVISYPLGLTEQNADDFFDGVDLVCDACDQVSAKALIRWHAKRAQVPVLMETSDRGMLDIERYDLEGSEYLHGRISEAMLKNMLQAEGWTPEFFNAFIDLSQASTRGVKSLEEVGNTLVGWPQLFSDVAAGGAHAAQVTRKILLGDSVPDARIYLEWDEQFVESVN